MAAARKKKIRTLIVDDAAFMRRVLVEILSAHDDIEVVGVARHGREALEAVESMDPDVITLDVDMPVMDGLTTIKHLMIRKPRPVIMVSGMADQGRVTFEALRLGAVDFFEKPSGTISLDMKDSAQELSQVIRIAAGLNPKAIRRVRSGPGKSESSIAQGVAKRILVVFAMDGACGTFIRMLSYLDSSLNLAVAAFQNVSPSVLSSYSSAFNETISWRIHTGQGGNLDNGMCYIAGFGESWRLELFQGVPRIELITGNPNPDSFLHEVAQHYGSLCMAVVLGGSENPAPSGFEELRQNGGKIVVLSPDSSVNGAAAREMLHEGDCEIAATEKELRMIIRNFTQAGDSREKAA